jgi:GH43 family beta-xylosidase
MKKLLCFALLAVAPLSLALAEKQTEFTNPLYQNEDAWVVKHEDAYFMCSSGPLNPTAVYVSKSPTLVERGEKVKVWEDPDNFGRVFAPELHFIQGKWYIYFCADARAEGGRHMAVVLQANTADPLDGFHFAGILFTGDEHGNAQANDFTVVTWQGKLYAFWGSLSDKYVHGCVMAPMDSPTKITVHRKEMGLDAEGPRAILRGDKLIMTGATGPFASKGYALTALEYQAKNGPIDDKKSWKNLGQLFASTDDVWGPSRASFTTSIDGKQYWMMYHSKIFPADDNGMRAANIKQFTFSSDDKPVFGTPPSPSTFQKNPSGDPGLGELYPAEAWTLSGGAVVESTNKNFAGKGYIGGFDKQGAKAAVSIDVPAAGIYRVVLRYANGAVYADEQKSHPTAYPTAFGTLTLYVNGQKIKRSQFHRTTNWDVYMFHGENLALKAGKNEITFQNDEGDNGEVIINYAAVNKASMPIRGLTASYFDDKDLKELKVTRIDPEISFNWGEGSPDPLIEKETFSARWEGTIEPLYSETYTFYSKSDNGRRLWIDGKPVLNKWDETHDETATGEIKLEKGKKYAIKYEYFEEGGGANTRLEWSSKSQVRETVPSARLTPLAAK